MTTSDRGTRGPADAAARRGPVLLAAGLLGAAFLVDAATAVGMAGTETYVTMNGGDMYLMHTGWWVRLHLGTAAATGLSGLVVLRDRWWTAVLAVVVATASLATDMVTFPYAPLPIALAIGFEVTAVLLLIRHGRLRRRPAGSAR